MEGDVEMHRAPITREMREVWNRSHQHEMVFGPDKARYRRPPCPRLETLANHRIAAYLRKGSG